MFKVNKVQSQTGEVIPEMILLEDQSQPLPSPLRQRIVKKYWCARKLRRGSLTGSPATDNIVCLATMLRSISCETQYSFRNTSWLFDRTHPGTPNWRSCVMTETPKPAAGAFSIVGLLNNITAYLKANGQNKLLNAAATIYIVISKLN
jgi:hypothetical protein